MGKAIAATRPLPAQPADCSRWELSNVKEGERLDVALLKTDQALSRANLRVRRCHQWYADLKGARNAGE